MQYESDGTKAHSWSSIILDFGIDFLQIKEWCKNHESPYRYNFDIYSDDEGIYVKSLTIRFESREDHMIFALTLMGT